MPAPTTPPRPEVRQLLRVALPTDANLVAFCLDFFPTVAERFANSMDRLAKVNLLLEQEDVEAIVAALKEYAPERLGQYERRRGAPPVSQKNPYRGLAAFQPEDAHLFCGREALTRTLWQRFEALFEKPDAVRLLPILGPSGSGKSSVARAGLLAALARSPVPGPQPLRIAIVKPGERPIESLARALVPLLPLDSTVLPANRQLEIERLLNDGEIPSQGLRRFAADLPDIAASPLCILVDQFEELYTLCKEPKERDTFVGILLHAASDACRHVSIVLTLRSDFLGETQRHHNTLNQLIAQEGVIVPGLSPEELRDAIAKPAQQSGRPLDAATVEILRTETQDSLGALPLLEFTLTRIWEAMGRGEEPVVTLRKLGGVGGALAGEAQKIYRSLSGAEQATAQRALVRLVRLSEGTRVTRRRAPVSELCGRGETDATVLAVLRKFSTANTRLITLGGEGALSLAEVTHEALFDHWTQLRAWIEQSRKDRGLYDRTMESAKLWSQAGRPAGRLWRPPDLDLLRDYQRRKPEDFGPLPTLFLGAAERRQQRERALSLGAVVAVVAALLIATGVYVAKERQRTDAVQEKLLASYVERGQQLLFELGRSNDGLLWLHRAQGEGSENPALPDLLKSAMQSPDATKVVLIGHKHWVHNAMFSPDGRRIVTASSDCMARVWGAEDGRPLVSLSHADICSIWTATFSPDSRRIVTASSDRIARVWDAEDGRLLASLSHGDNVWTAAFSPDGRRIVTASSDRIARVWDAEDGRLLASLSHGDNVWTAAFSPDGRRIVTASDDKTARVWDAKDGRLVNELKGHGDSVNSATFSPDGRRIATASADHTARVWDAKDGRLLAELKGHVASVLSATFSPDGRRIVTASVDHTAQVWDGDGSRLLAKLTSHRDSVVSATFSSDGHHIVTASVDHTARVWDAKDGRLVNELKGHGDSVNSATFSPDGLHIVTSSNDQTVRVWEADGSRLLTRLKGHGDSVNSATFSPDGRRIVTAGADHTAQVWDAKDGRLLVELKGHVASVLSAMFSPDGRRIVTASMDNTARVWNSESGQLLVELKGHGGSVLSATFSRDGRRIVTASLDSMAREWDAEGGQLLGEFKLRAQYQGPGASVKSATIDLGGWRILTVFNDQTVTVWWTGGVGSSKLEFKGHVPTINRVAASPDGIHIVTASVDHTARIWELHGDLSAELKGHGDSVFSATFSPDGRRIVTASADRTARVWDARNGQLLAELKGHGDSVLSAMFSPDGRRIVTASADRTARVWDSSPETRNYAQIEKLIHCHVPAQFGKDESSLIVFRNPTPEECQNVASVPHL